MAKVVPLCMTGIRWSEKRDNDCPTNKRWDDKKEKKETMKHTTSGLAKALTLGM